MHQAKSPTFSAVFAGTLALAGILAVPGAALARQQRQPVEAQPQTERIVVAPDQDATETREKLEDMLRKLPPTVGRVLRADPSLMSNEGYLATYPALASFLKQHPEVRSNPAFFFEHIGPLEFWRPSPPETPREQAIRMWSDIFQQVTVASVFIAIALGLIWLIRTLIEYRRWIRTSKVHTDVHNKLLDRFTTNDDLMAYIQTPAGRRFLESAPLTVEGPARPVGAPFSRILWSLQVGIVLGAGGLGLLFVSGRVIEEVAQPLFAIGVLALTVGAGFVVSSAASLLLSRRLGLFEPLTPPSREHADSGVHPTS